MKVEEYYHLQEGDLIMKGDEVDVCNDSWRDPPIWKEVVNCIGERAPNPAYPSHRNYRRKIFV